MVKRIFVLLLCLTSTIASFAEEIDLMCFEHSLYSPNGEDGILSKLFRLIKPRSEFCVEIGANDGITRSYTYLLRKQGWNCALFDRSYRVPEFSLYREFITAENVNERLERYNVPDDLDLLAIDVGYNDFYVWLGLSEKFRPLVVLIGYNSQHLPSEDKVVKYRPYFNGNVENDYFGASILALFQLGRSKGYSLIYADSSGSNLFFIRDDILSANHLQFKGNNDVAKIYRPSSRSMTSDPKQRSYFSSTQFIK